MRHAILFIADVFHAIDNFRPNARLGQISQGDSFEQPSASEKARLLPMLQPIARR